MTGKTIQSDTEVPENTHKSFFERLFSLINENVRFADVGKNVLKALFLLLVALCIFSIVFLLVEVSYSYKHQTTIFDNVFIDNANVEGKTKNQALQSITAAHGITPQKNLYIVYNDEQIATFTAEQLQIRRNTAEIVDRAYLIGRSTNLPSMYLEQIESMLKLRRFDFYTQLTYNEEVVSDFVQEIADSYKRPPQNALFTFENGRVTSFKKEVMGTSIDQDQLLKDIHRYIENVEQDGPDITITVHPIEIAPEVTLSSINNLGIEESIGVGKSDYSHSIASRIYNIKLAASKFDGVIVPQGAEFSFDDIIGDISANTGYQQAYVIQNGRTVLGDGGGVCQVSTTMFRAAINSGLRITERNAHAYRVSYYENDSDPGYDATIFTPTVDLRFVNDTPAAILIQEEIDEVNHLLSFVFYGKSDGRKPEFSDVVVWDVVAPPEPLYQDDPNLPTGQVKQIDYAAWGSKASFDYKVVRGGEIIFGQTFFSNYRPWQAVFLRGTGPV
ncbi:VanW family protein [Candidatus Woesebacteria bacterium]|nr:VanW family protein [Candidatus Woesebacteria bacterium]